MIRRLFIPGVTINQAGERAIKYRRRSLTGEPGLHFCPFGSAPRRERGMVIGVVVELNYRRTVSKRYCFLSGSPARDLGAIFRPLFPLETRCFAWLTRHPTFPPGQEIALVIPARSRSDRD